VETIACLHTAAGNIAVFGAACPPGARLTRTLRADLLQDAEARGRADGADRGPHRRRA
jgi:hypothetical protein